MSYFILPACILAHLNNIAEPSSFNKHLNHLKKNKADDDTPSNRIFNVAPLSRHVTPSQEELNEQMEEDDLLPAAAVPEITKQIKDTLTVLKPHEP